MNPDDRRSLRRQLLALALPLMASNLSQSLLSLTDTLMVGHLSDERPLAALGHANVVILVIFLVMSAPFLGIQALVARRLGEGRERAAGQVATSGLVLGTLSGIAFGFAGWLFADDVAVLVAQDRDVTRLAADYLQIRWTFALPITLLWAWRGFLYGASRTRFDMGVALTVNALNVLLTWMLIWGKWGAPELGMPGAAWGSALATTTGALMMAGDSLRPSIRRRYGIYGKGQVDLKIMAAIVRLSMPRAVQAMAFGGAIGFFHLIERSCGPIGLAASGVIWRFFGAAVLISISVGASAATLVGRNLGAGRPDRAETAAEVAMQVGVAINVVIGLLVITFPHAIVGVFTDEAEIVSVGAPALRLMATFMFVDSVGIILGRVLVASGCTVYVMTSEIVCQIVIMLVAANLAAHYVPGNLVAMWAAWVCYMVAWHVAMMIKFTSGTWKQVRI